jgi:hypothetical protein
MKHGSQDYSVIWADKTSSWRADAGGEPVALLVKKLAEQT